MYAAITTTKNKRLTADNKERATWKYSYGEVFCALTSWLSKS